MVDGGTRTRNSRIRRNPCLRRRPIRLSRSATTAGTSPRAARPGLEPGPPGSEPGVVPLPPPRIGTDGGIRTRTDGVLSAVPLPLGYVSVGGPRGIRTRNLLRARELRFRVAPPAQSFVVSSRERESNPPCKAYEAPLIPDLPQCRCVQVGRLERPRPASKAGRVTLPSHLVGADPGDRTRRALVTKERRAQQRSAWFGDGVNDGTRTRFRRGHNAVPRRLRPRSPCTRLGSNQRSPRCERGAFPLGHTCGVRRARFERATCSSSESRSPPLSYRRLVVPGRIERPPEVFQTSALPD